MRDVLSGKKSLLKKSACRFVNVPRYDELGARNVFERFKSDPQVM